MSDNQIDPRKYAAAVAEATRRKDQIERLTEQLNAANAKIAELETHLGDALDGFEALEAELAEASKAIPADEKDKRISELERSIKERDLRDQFNTLAKGKVRDDALDAAWKLSGLTPDVELPENGLAEAVEALVKGHAFLAPAPAAQPEPAASGSRGADASGKPIVQPTGQPAPGATRGNPNTSAPGAAKGDPELGRMADYLQQTGRSSNPYRVF